MSQINLQNNIKLYDNNYNLIVSKSFDGYVYKICYYDKKFYCKYRQVLENQTNSWGGKKVIIHTMMSEDFIDWKDIGENRIPNTNSKVSYINNSVKIKGRNNFVNVIYEDGFDKFLDTMYGDIFVASNIKKVVTDIGTEATSYGNNLLSYDNIYL